jgi:hypothetical protein
MKLVHYSFGAKQQSLSHSSHILLLRRIFNLTQSESITGPSSNVELKKKECRQQMQSDDNTSLGPMGQVV